MAPNTVRRTRAKDITGKRFGLLTAVRPTDERRHGIIVWFCTCDCGGTNLCNTNTLLSGQTISCGCRSGAPTHGHARNDRHTPEYSAWASMRQRCLNPKHKKFPHYGGRGITICERWRTFEAFYEDMGQRPDGTSIDRRDNDGPYDKDNCRWATPKQQLRNTRKANATYLTFNGKSASIAEWSDITGLSRNCLLHRLHRQWSHDRILTTPSAASKR